MHGANCWLMGLSFLLGLLLTFAFTIRRVNREVPVSAPWGGGASAPTTPIPAAGTATIPGRAAGAGAGSAAKLTGGTLPSEAPTAQIAVGAPYGDGSARAGAGGVGPSGWTIKGNEDSMLYHGPQSPAYDVTIAEVWFKDEETATAAGFNRWDSGRKKKKKKK